MCTFQRIDTNIENEEETLEELTLKIKIFYIAEKSGSGFCKVFLPEIFRT